MDNNNWSAAQGQMALGPPQGQVGGGEVSAVPSVTPPAAMDAGDWRTHLQAGHRQRIVNKIMDTLKRHIPSSGPEGLEDLKKIAITFEEKIYTAATSQTDYLRKISLKMLTMETKSQNPMASSVQSNAGKNPPDQAVHGMQSQIQNQQLSVPMVSGQSQPRQQLIAQKMQANTMSSGVQSSAILTSAILNPVNLTQVAMPNVIGQNSNLQNMQSMTSIAQNPVGNSMGQGIPSNVFTNSQRLLPGRQQQVVPQQQQQPQQHNQNAQTYLYQQQFQNHQLMKQKLQQGGMAQSLMQHNLLPPGQIQTSSQAVMQPSVMQSAPLSSLQQNKPSSVPQLTQPVLQPQSQSVVRQQQQPQQQASFVHQQQTSISQQPLLQAPPQPQQQQHQMIGQQSNSMSIQHNQLIGQSNGIQDGQQQQQRLLGQQGNIPNLQQQQLMGKQNSLSNMHQPQMGPQGNVSGHHQQSMLGNQSGNSGMPTNQHSMHMLQQSKVSVQQQMQQNAMTMLQSQNQLSQQVSKQQMVSNIQSQPVPLQHLPQQSSLLQREVQQRLPISGSLLQQQNVVEQQKHLFPSQRAHPEASSNSSDSTAPMGNINGGDWQEDVYQKIKSMKDMYFLDLNDLLMKIATKLHQHDFLPQQPRNEHLERFRNFKGCLERVVGFLCLNKNDVQFTHRDKLGTVEKQIMNILNSNRPRRSASFQQGQPPQPQMPTVQHSQPQSQISQKAPQDNQMHSQMQPMNIHSSMTTMLQNNLTSLQHNSLSSVSLSSSQHNMMNSLQPSTTLDIGQSNALNPLQQMNLNLIQNQHIKQEQQTLPTQQLKQHMHQRQMQQMLARQQLMHQQQQQHQQQPQLQQHQQQQQVKQHHPSQLSGHEMSPLHQMTDSIDLKLRQQMGVKSVVLQQHHLNGQRAVYHQLKSGSPFPVSTPQVLPAHSPQLPPHPSPQIDQQNMLISMAKAGTPLQSANSPFVSPSPSTPLAPSPMPGDSEKLNSSISSLPNSANVGHSRVTTLTAAVQSLAIGTPGISASPLLAECSSLDGPLVNASTAVSCKSDVVEQPLERLIKAVKSISHKTLTASVADISSVVSMVDRIAGSAPWNGSRAAVGEDLVATTKCRLQARNFFTQDGPVAKRMRRFTSAMPSNAISSVSSVYDTFKQLNGSDAFELESTAMSSIRRPKIEANHALVQEIREINRLLIETVLEISDDDDVDPTAVAAAAEGAEGIIVKCSFSGVALSHLKSLSASTQMSPIQPLRLLIPTNYPQSSPILVDKFPIAVSSKEYEYVSMKAKSSFSTSLRTLSQPMSLSEIAKTWDVCAHAVVSEFVQLSGGGTFSSKYGTWESCLTTF